MILSLTAEQRSRVIQEALEKYQPIQNAEELDQAMQVVAKLSPQVVVEIGTFRGGSLRCWQACAAGDALLVGTDTPGTPPEVQANLKACLFPAQVGKIFLGDNRSKSFRDEALQYIAEFKRMRHGKEHAQPIDFLFIDGNHHWEDVSLDYALWEPFVRSGGIIGFHDILETNHPEIDSPRFWREKVLGEDRDKWSFSTACIAADLTKAYGIGLVQKK